MTNLLLALLVIFAALIAILALILRDWLMIESAYARLLREYDLPAADIYGLESETLKSEIANGRPVIASP